MSDLISRSALLEAINKVVEEYKGKELIPSIFSANAVILNQPIAYDVDKVVEHLEAEKSDWNYDYNVPINKAIEIVKAGGKSESST